MNNKQASLFSQTFFTPFTPPIQRAIISQIDFLIIYRSLFGGISQTKQRDYHACFFPKQFAEVCLSVCLLLPQEPFTFLLPFANLKQFFIFTKFSRIFFREIFPRLAGRFFTSQKGCRGSRGVFSSRGKVAAAREAFFRAGEKSPRLASCFFKPKKISRGSREKFCVKHCGINRRAYDKSVCFYEERTIEAGASYIPRSPPPAARESCEKANGHECLAGQPPNHCFPRHRRA